jgi:hypothetical protein
MRLSSMGTSVKQRYVVFAPHNLSLHLTAYTWRKNISFSWLYRYLRVCYRLGAAGEFGRWAAPLVCVKGDVKCPMDH